MSSSSRPGSPGPLPASPTGGPDGRVLPGWAVVVPLKGTADGKSRLAPLGSRLRRSLAVAMALDTVSACSDVVGAKRVLVVTPDAATAARCHDLGLGVVADPGRGLDEAVRAGAEAARRLAPCVAVVVGDLPCLTAAALRAVLQAAGRHPRAFVPDADGSGTVLLTAGPGVPIESRFGAGSARRHAQVAVELDAPDGMRLDVDRPGDWSRARLLGVGPASSRVAQGGSPA